MKTEAVSFGTWTFDARLRHIWKKEKIAASLTHYSSSTMDQGRDYVDDLSAVEESPNEGDEGDFATNRKKKAKKAGGKKKLGRPRKPALPVVYRLQETINIIALTNSHCIMALNSEVVQHAVRLLKLHKKAHGEVRTEYSHAREFAHLKTGRVYATGPSIQNLKGALTRICCRDMYVDIDIVKCAPYMLLLICARILYYKPVLLDAYVDDPSAFFNRVRLVTGQDNIPDKVIKQAINAMIHPPGSYESAFQKAGLQLADCSLFDNMKNEFRTIVSKCRIEPTFARFWEASKDRENPDGTFISLVWQHFESIAISELIGFCENSQLRVDVIKHDGILIRWDNSIHRPFTDDILRRAEQALEDCAIGFTGIKLVRKSLLLTPEDEKLICGPKHLHMLPNDYARIIHSIQVDASERSLVRITDGTETIVYKPHATIPRVYENFCDSNSYVNAVIMKKLSFATALIGDGAFKWAEKTSHPQFPLLSASSFDSRIIAFPGGYITLGKGAQVSFSKWTGEEKFYTKHYMECELPEWDVELQEFILQPTPLWTNMLAFQLDNYTMEPGELPMSTWLEGLIGRLNYDIGENDNWQVVPWLLGDANTGKSTSLQIVTAMFPRDMTAAITDTFEQKFGTHALKKAKCIISPDTPENIHHLLSATTFQSMITGDPMSTVGKYKTAKSGKWRAPSIWASNHPASWPDKSGAVSRRIAYSLFQRLVVDRDTTLKQRIIKDELATIFIRSLMTYHRLVRVVGKEDFFKKCPAPMVAARDAIATETNPLEEFIQNGSATIVVVPCPGATLPFHRFEEAYTRFLDSDPKYKGKKGNAIGRDHYVFNKHGYSVEIVSSCKICAKPANRANCGEHFDRRNRTNRRVIYGLDLRFRSGNEQRILDEDCGDFGMFLQ